MIKKLILISAMLMATSVWSEVTYLECERFETEYNRFVVNFVIDTEKGTVKFGVNESEYFEIGTEIRFTKFGTKRWTWILDRTSGDLDKFIAEVFDPDNSIVTGHEKFTCTRAEALF